MIATQQTKNPSINACTLLREAVQALEATTLQPMNRADAAETALLLRCATAWLDLHVRRGQVAQVAPDQRGMAVDPADPWRGLYDPARLPARDAYGLIMCHPDVPAWADGRESSLLPLFNAQGFELVVAGAEFGEEAAGNGVDGKAREMADWTPEGPGADWRLVWLGETEDELGAWFVPPLAMGVLRARGIHA